MNIFLPEICIGEVKSPSASLDRPRSPVGHFVQLVFHDRGYVWSFSLERTVSTDWELRKLLSWSSHRDSIGPLLNERQTNKTNVTIIIIKKYIKFTVWRLGSNFVWNYIQVTIDSFLIVIYSIQNDATNLFHISFRYSQARMRK